MPEFIVRRPDLEAQEVSLPPYLIDAILPYLPKPQIAGTLYYQPWHADVSAQSGRNTANLGEITSNTMTAATTTFSCIEKRARVKMGYTQLKGYATKEGADLAMGRMAKRAFYNSLEVACAKALLDVASPKDGTSNIVATLDAAITALRDKGIGRLAMVTSNFNFVRLKNDTTVQARMRNTGVAIRDLEPRNVSKEQMAAILGLDDVLVGRDDLWHAGIDAEDRGNVALVVLPNREEDCAEAVQLGRTIYFDWDSASEHFVMESWHDAFVDAEVVDAKGLVDIKILNASLKTTVQCFAASAESDSASASASESVSASM